MSTDVLYEEIQRLGRKSVNDFFKVTTGLFFVALVFNFIRQRAVVNQLTLGVFAGFLICAFVALLLGIKMITQIRKDGIYVRFPPFESSFSKFSWKDIKDIYLREYNAFTEYNWWGIRLGFLGVKYGASGKAYLFTGKTGIQILLSDDSKVLIGTQCPNEIADVLKNLPLELHT